MRSRGAAGKTMWGPDWPAAARNFGEALATNAPTVKVENFSRKERRASVFMVVVERARRIVRQGPGPRRATSFLAARRGDPLILALRAVKMSQINAAEWMEQPRTRKFRDERELESDDRGLPWPTARNAG